MRNQGKMSKSGNCKKFQIPWSSCRGGSEPEVLSNFAQAIAALTKLKFLIDNNISHAPKAKLTRPLVVSIFLCACETWFLTAELEERMQAHELSCYGRLFNIS